MDEVRLTGEPAGGAAATDATGDAAAIPIVRLDSVDSTNDEARRRLAARGRGGGDGKDTGGPFAIVAGEQTAGRGTRGRHWDSPAGAGLYLSLALPGDRWPLAASGASVAAGPPVELAHTLAAGVAAVDAVATVTGIVPRLKPVNDLLVDDRKLGGILVETEVRGGRFVAMIVGLGLNLRRARRIVAAGARPAISVEELRPWSRPVGDEERERLVSAVVTGLADWVACTVTAGPRPAVEAWRDRAVPGAALPAPF